MPASPFTLAFDHVDECERCNYGERRLCPTGQALFNAAHEACKLIAGDEVPASKGSA